MAVWKWYTARAVWVRVIIAVVVAFFALAIIGAFIPNDKPAEEEGVRALKAPTQSADADAIARDQGTATPAPAPTVTPSPTPAPTASPTPEPTPTPAPTSVAVSQPTFVVNSLPVGCHQESTAASAVVVQHAPGAVLAMDMTIRQGDGVWHREVSRQCWIRTNPGPVRSFGSTQEAEGFASKLRPIVLQGRGQTATNPVTLGAGIYTVAFTHNGARNFIVKAFQDNKEDLLVNKIGAYQGTRYVAGGSPVTFDIQADGAWSVRLEQIRPTSTASLTGTGDAISGLFDPPSSGPWEVNHSGQRNFIVWLHCAGGSDLVQNLIGPVAGSRVVQFRRGPCFWEVQADGQWSLNPRQ